MSGNNQGHTLDITSPRGNAYTHPSGPGFANPYNRYSTAPEATSYGHAHSEQSSTEHGFHAAHLSGADFGSPSSSHGVTSTARSISGSIGHNTGAHYMGGHGVGLSDPYQLYSPHLRQSSSHMHPALSRSVDQHQSSQLAQPTHVQPQSAVAAAHLAHSIHEVSGLAAAYHAYHQYHQQQQAGRHGLGVPVPTSPVPTPGAHAHYHNLLNAQSRAYYPPPSGLDDQFSTHRDLGLYTTHSERRDPKSAYLAETYRESQATSGRFLF
ncbi:hypothetical protein D915_001000 [Fasciola hepatica]|uniref:Uncharacterized protein n=1 Tax=Fasciola hepatica TaxID=6192 RepID=A0A2H1CTW2_FASHE|nr:hypothetical protein D915_001000 [Fasciola hepatica]